jgi:hypothetical protein
MTRIHSEQKRHLAGLILGESFLRLIAILFLFLLAGLAVYQLSPPRPLPADTAVSDFSSERAARHLQVIARNPHPIGSGEAERVRDYLVAELNALGLETSVQHSTAVSRRSAAPFNAGSIENVVAKRSGTDGQKSVLLVAHYDSVPGSNGASDNGIAVSALLETARAVKTDFQSKNDLIFLFTDGEEAGLLGARAFVDEHPWAKSVGVVLNFDARGNAGPVVMFETSDGNSELIEALAKAAPHPIANSLSQEIYKLMPNDTDLSVFKEAGYQSLNFANIEGISYYHTPLDSLKNANESSLQHHGSYALALARHFGNSDLHLGNTDDQVYFNLLGSMFVKYSASWVTPLSLVTALFFATALAIGFRRRLLSIRGICAGSLALIISVAGSVLVVLSLWWVVQRVQTGYELMPHGQANDGYVYMSSFVLLALVVTSAVFRLFRRRIGVPDLTGGALAVWLVLMLASNLYFPGASYLFHWPMMFAAAATAIWFATSGKERPSPAIAATLTVGSVPAVLLLSSIIYLVFVALTLRLAAVGVGMVVLSLGLLVPQLVLASKRNHWRAHGVLAATGLLLILITSISFGFGDDNPKPNTIFYAMNADSRRAVWASIDSSPDEWTSQFLTSVERGDLNEYAPSSFNRFLKCAAPPVQLEGPQVVLVEDRVQGDVRVTRMRIASPRRAPAISLVADSEVEVLGAWVNGKEVGPSLGKRWGLKYHNIPEGGIELILETKSSGTLKLRAVDISYGLPEILDNEFLPRPAHLVPALFPYCDTTLLSKSFTFTL